MARDNKMVYQRVKGRRSLLVNATNIISRRIFAIIGLTTLLNLQVLGEVCPNKPDPGIFVDPSNVTLSDARECLNIKIPPEKTTDKMQVYWNISGVDFWVESGQTLSDISRSSYGDPKLYRLIIQMNNFKTQFANSPYQYITDPNVIRISGVERGRKIRLIFVPKPEAIPLLLRTEQSPATDASTPIRAVPTISIAGSGTVTPIMAEVARCFLAAGLLGQYGAPNSPTQFVIDTRGTGYVPEALCPNQGQEPTDIAVASDDIAEEAWKRCGDPKNIAKFVIAYDAVAIAVNSSFKSLRESKLSYSQLYTLFKEGVFQESPMNIYLPGSKSGTLSYTSRILCGSPDAAAEFKAKIRLDFDDYGWLAAMIACSDNGAGILPYHFLRAAGSNVVPLPVNRVPLEEDKVEDGTYKLKRPLFLFVLRSRLKDPTINSYVSFVVFEAAKILKGISFFPRWPVHEHPVPLNVVYKTRT